MPSNMNNQKLCPEHECTLCMACFNACPKQAIFLAYDKYGYEKLQINNDLCIHCGLCEKVCQTRRSLPRNYPALCYAGQCSEKQKLKLSASGGAFQMLAQGILEDGGICYGAEQIRDANGDFRVSHSRISSNVELHRVLNSKYIPSIIGTSYRQAKSDLEQGLTVLFSGTPCQIQGLYAYLGKTYDNLFTVDIICHGVTSTNLFNDYVHETEKIAHITITDYQFRDKSISWGTNFSYQYYKNNSDSGKKKIKHCPREASSYMIHYLQGNIFRENCYQCSLSCGERISDITLGDYWEIEREHPEFVTKSKPNLSLHRGVSCIMLNTDHSSRLLAYLSSKMILHKVTFQSISDHNDNLKRPSPRGTDRDKLLEIYKKDGYAPIDNAYHQAVGKKAIFYSMKNSLKSFLPDRLRIRIYQSSLLSKLIFH